MRERFRSFDSKISFFAFADIITAVSGMLIFITLLLATDLGRPTDNRSQAANAELERQLQETLAQQAKADVENRGLQSLLTTANTAPAPDKLESDISRLRAELADERSKHAGMGEQLAASKSALAERDKLLGITKVEETIEERIAELEALGREEAKVREETAALEQQIAGVKSKIVKLHAREGQVWLIPDKSQTTKEPILMIISSGGLRIERFDHPDQSQQFDKSGTRAGFEAYLKRAKPNDQYIVFMIRPSGIGVFKDLVQTAREKGFEVGFDALEENQEIHFSSPPPLDDQAVSEKRPDHYEGEPSRGAPGRSTSRGGTAGSAGNPGPTSAGGPGSTTGTVDSGGADGASASTNLIGSAGSTNTSGREGSTNASASAGSSTNSSAQSGTNTATTSSTNSTGSASGQPAPPPKPKSWWQRFLEWIGLG